MEGEKKSRLVFYHYPCTDGVFAALAIYLEIGDVWTAYKGLPIDKGNPDKVKELVNYVIKEGFEDLFLLDYCGPDDFLLLLLQAKPPKLKEITIIDHHKTAIETYDPEKQKALAALCPSVKLHFQFDINRSASRLTRAMFQPYVFNLDQDLWWMFEYVDDHDLYQYQHADTKAFIAGFDENKFELDYQINPEIFEQILALKLPEVIENGKMALEKKKKMVEDLVQAKFILTLPTPDDNKAIRCYATETMDHSLISDTGNRLAQESEKSGFVPLGAVCVPTPGSSEVPIKLRSINKYDSSRISKQYKGGGGHLMSSAFIVTVEEYEKMKLS